MPSLRYTQIVAAAALSLLAPAAGLAADDALSLEDVMRAWRATQDKVRSGEFSWTTTRWLKQGAISPPGVPPLNAPRPVPEEDLTWHYTRKFIFRDGLVRYENEGPARRPDGRIIDQRDSYAWNGNAATQLHEDGQVPIAFIDGLNQQLTENEVRPIQFSFRMFQPSWFVFAPEQYEIAERDVDLDGKRCLLIKTSRQQLAAKAAKGRLTLSANFWVSPERDFAIVRYAAMNEENGRTTLEFAIDHELDAERGVWAPVRWTITTYGSDGPQEIATSVVEQYELNPAVPHDAFELLLPPDTMVTDVRTGEDFIARGDGTKRVVTREEMLRGATYEDIVRTESGQAGLRKSRGRGLLSSPATYVWAVGLLLLLAASVLYLRRRMH